MGEGPAGHPLSETDPCRQEYLPNRSVSQGYACRGSLTRIQLPELIPRDDAVLLIALLLVLLPSDDRYQHAV